MSESVAAGSEERYASCQDAVETFILDVAELKDEFVFVTLLPWSDRREKPPFVLTADCGEADLTPERCQALAENKKVVLLVCTFATPEELGQPQRMLETFLAMENIRIIILQRLPVGEVIDGTEAVSAVLKRQEELLNTAGADDVLVNTPSTAASVRSAVSRAIAEWQSTVLRMQEILDAESPHLDREDVLELRHRLERLLWESIPQAVMPHFVPVNRDMKETGTRIDKYRLIMELPTRRGRVLQAHDKHGKMVVIKVVEKSKVTSPSELEGMYRELRFLSEILQHPNIAKGLGMLNSPTRVYLIIDYHGSNNLNQLCKQHMDERLDLPEVSHCFEGVAQGLAYCHSKSVVHRALSPEHVMAMYRPSEEAFHCVIIDFHNSMVARGTNTSAAVCGDLPCMSPEMARKSLYDPQMTDIWSLGVLLLEIAGGLGSLSSFVPYDPAGAVPEQVADSIAEALRPPGSRARALAQRGGVADPEIIRQLDLLLQPDPEARPRVADLLPPVEPPAAA